ncbi:MAG: FHA domain-containing protein [Anaerolineales bacterium]|nr:FHA domain-containing protein [Anaerolineales bacterium]
MLKTQPKKNYLRAVLIWIILLSTTVTAGAQAGRVVDISPPETAEFPLMTIYFDTTERDGSVITDLLEDQIMLREDGVEQEFLDFKALTPGIQLVMALNVSAPFAIQDISGKSRFNYLTEALLDWANQTPLSSPDDLSLITNDGVELTHLDSKEDFIAALEEYSPDLRETEPDFNVLARAIEIASDPVDQLGMKRVVLLFTPPTTPAGSAAIESLVSRAKDSQVMVYTILVSSPAFFNSTGAEVLKSLTAETNGNFFTFSGEEPLPDFISLFAPLRSTYLINYQSQIVTSGSHTLELTMSSDLGESQGQREFFLDVQPPNPIFISPPRVITRKMVQTGSDTLPIADFEPGSITLGLIVEFPDQHPRELEEVIFRVDGEVVSRLTEEPYDHFVWDLSQYENSAVHYLTIEAVDLLGLSKQSIQTPIEVIIDIPPQSISTILADNAPAFAGLALVLILGMLLFILISRGTIKPEFKFGLNRFFRNGGKEKNNTSQLKKINQDGEFIGSSGNPNSLEIKKQKAFRLIPISDVLQQQVPEPIQGGEDDVILGNDPSPGIINIPHPSVVKQHARITIQPDGEFVITDEGSPSGTWINYKQILSNKPHPLKDGDIIHIGEAGFRYQLMDKASDLPFTEEKTT